MISSLLFIFFVFYFAVATEKQSFSLVERLKQAPPPNIDYLGRGYNIFKANPLGKTVDEGFRLPIFDVQTTPVSTPTEWGYIAPDGMFAAATESCQLSSSSEIVETSKEYFNSLRAFVSIEGSGSYGAHSGSFSASVDYNRVASGMSSNTKKYIISTAMCEVFRCEILEYKPPKISSVFLESVKVLSQSNKKDSDFFQFFKSYGTHVTTYLTMGSRYSIKSEFTTSAYKKMKSSGLNIQAAASYSYDGLVSSGSVSAKSEMDKKKKDKETFEQSRSSTEILSVGALPPSDGNAKSWSSSAAENPVPIKYKLAAIWDYFFFLNGKKTYLIQDKTLRNRMKVASKNYNVHLLKKMDKPKSKQEEIAKSCDYPAQIYKNNRCLKLYTNKETWYSAKSECEKFGGSLVTIDSYEKQRFIKGMSASQELWIGLNDLAQEGNYVWINHAKPIYLNWKRGEPNNKGNEDCVLMRKDGYWNDEGCSVRNKFICERSYIKPKFQTPQKPIGSCDGQLYEDSNKQKWCIKYYSSKKTWDNAKQTCQGWKGDLVMIKSSQKSNWLRHKLTANKFWIGLSDAARENQWKWSDRTELSFNMWSPGEPNNSGNEDCAHVRPDGNWNDERCSDKIAFICERKYGGSKTTQIPQKTQSFKGSCPSSFSKKRDSNGNYHCLKLVKSSKSWDNANSYCRNLGGSLAVPRDSAKNQAMKSLLPSHYRIWVGLNDKHREGSWKDMNGNSIGYSNWQRGEPNNYRGGEDCLQLRGNGKWNDDKCSRKFYFMCEYSKQSRSSQQQRSTSTNVQSSCSSGFERKRDSNGKYHCLKLVKSSKSWDDSRRYCQSLGARLAIPYDYASNQAIRSVLKSYHRVWIGVNDRAREGNWVDLTGNNARYKNWGRGEPNNYRGGEDCVQLRGNGYWNDDKCSRKFYFVCESGKGSQYKQSSHQTSRSSTSSSCPSSFSRKRDSRGRYHCLKLVRSSKTWDDSQRYCNGLGGRLAVPFDYSSNIAMKSVLRSHYRVWIGANDRAREGSWRNTKGNLISFTFWGPGEPNNYRGGEDCAQLRGNGYWNDDKCSRKFYFLCEYKR